MIGFGSWDTEVEFKDIRIEADGKTFIMMCPVAEPIAGSGKCRMAY